MKSLLWLLSFAVIFCCLWGWSRATERRSSAKKPRTGTASWYGEEYRGLPMANGKPFDPDAMTCAMWAVRLGTVVRVYRADGYFIDVTVTDRGPAPHLGRLIDLSKAAFARLAPTRIGTLHVEVIPLEKP